MVVLGYFFTDLIRGMVSSYFSSPYLNLVNIIIIKNETNTLFFFSFRNGVLLAETQKELLALLTESR